MEKKSSFIASFVEHTAYSVFKMHSVLILFFFILISHYSPKSHLFLKFQGFSERSSDIVSFVEHPVSFVEFENIQCPNSSFLYFVLSRLNQSECVKVIFSGNSRCSAKEAVILLLSWAPFIQRFQNIQSLDFSILILICHYEPKVHV